MTSPSASSGERRVSFTKVGFYCLEDNPGNLDEVNCGENRMSRELRPLNRAALRPVMDARAEFAPECADRRRALPPERPAEAARRR